MFELIVLSMACLLLTVTQACHLVIDCNISRSGPDRIFITAPLLSYFINLGKMALVENEQREEIVSMGEFHSRVDFQVNLGHNKNGNKN